MGIMFNKWPRDGTLKIYRKNVACRAGSTQAYVAQPVKGDKQSVQSVPLWFELDYMYYMNPKRYFC